MEFTEDEWRGLAEHCRERQRALRLVAVLARGGGPARAGRAAALEDRLGRGVERRSCSTASCDTGAPVVLSTGMSPLAETDAAVARVQARGRQVGVLQCTTAYPVSAGTRRPEPGAGLSRAVRVLGGAVGSLGDDLSGPRRRGARHRHPRGARGAVARDVRAGRGGVGDHQRAAAAGGRRPLHRDDARPPGGQGRVGARHRAAAAAVHAQRRGAPGRCRPAPCSRRATWRSRSRAPACRPSGSPTRRPHACARPVVADQLLAADDVEGLS